MQNNKNMYLIDLHYQLHHMVPFRRDRQTERESRAREGRKKKINAQTKLERHVNEIPQQQQEVRILLLSCFFPVFLTSVLELLHKQLSCILTVSSSKYNVVRPPNNIVKQFVTSYCNGSNCSSKNSSVVVTIPLPLPLPPPSPVVLNALDDDDRLCCNSMMSFLLLSLRQQLFVCPLLQ